MPTPIPPDRQAATAAIDLLQREIANPDTQWSLGTFGAIAEFSRDRDEPVALRQSDTGVSAVTPRGGIAIRADLRNRPFASESVTKSGWNQRIALCLPEEACAMNRRTELTELGADRESLRSEDRESVLFDLGLGALQADFCVRIDDRDTSARLRAHAGRPVFEPGNPAMGLILAANPHRVFLSRLGRIEVYQPIPPASGKSPEGPHTHVLPKLLNSKRTHPATEPVPVGWIPCAHLYPANPVRDALGAPQPFDAARHDAFQRMIEAFGDPENLAIKRRVAAAIAAGEPPSDMAWDRHGRAGIRIALRQLKAAGHPPPILTAWLASFDHSGPEGDEDEAALHHEG
jgi:class 3 adenylate cyclase